MKTRLLALGLVLALIAVGTAAGLLLRPARVDGKSAPDWLARAMHSTQTVTYEAHGIVRDGALTATFTEKRGPDGAMRLHYTDTAHRGAYVAVNQGTVTVRDRSGAVTRQQAMAQIPMPQLTRQYRLQLAGMTRMAGRSAVILLVRDRKTGVLLTRYALDRATGVPLQTITHHANAKTARATTYTRITFRPVGAHECRADGGALTDGALTLPQAEARAGFRWAAPAWVPAGFTPAAYRAAPCPCGCGGRTIQVTYRDGLRSFMVAEKVEKTGPGRMPTHGCMPSGASSHCGDNDGCVACSATGTPLVTRTLPDRTIVVVGEITPDTLQRIANSITP
jgi:negative regulator of sigma E activity